MQHTEPDALYHDPPSSVQLSEYRQLMMRKEDAERDLDESDTHSEADSQASAAYEDAEEQAVPVETKEATPAANHYDPYAAPAEPSAVRDDSDQAICRICLDGPGSGETDGESLGRLLSPCRCKGTMKYVHATCLDRWRSISARNSSVVCCDQCGAPYRFRKSRFVGLATSPSLLFGVSVLLFLALIWTVGFAASLALDRYDAKPAAPESRRGWWAWLTRADEDNEDAWTSKSSWSDLDTGYSYGSYLGYGGLYYEPAAYFKLVKEAVRQFASGEATDAVKGLVGVGDDGVPPAAPATEDDERGFWSSLKWEWKYGEDGIWPGQDPEPAASTPEIGDKYDARSAAPLDARPPARSTPKPKTPKRTRPMWLDKLALQFSLGFSLVGILSFVNLMLGFSFLGPFNLHNFGLGRSFARLTGGGRRNNRAGGGGEGVNLASVLLVLLVMIGIVRALHLVYKGVRAASRRFLSRLEAAIVDWHGEDEPARAQRHPDGPQIEHQRDDRLAWWLARAGD